MGSSNIHLSFAYSSLSENPKAMKVVEVDTGIYCPVKKLRDQSRLQVYETTLCEVTKCIAGYLTTDKRLFKSSIQYSLFA